MDGRSGLPSASGSTAGAPLRTVATSEFVVPRSMPTARRCSCGAGDMPGSEICRSAIDFSGGSTAPSVDLLVGGVDLGFELVQEHQFPDQLGGAGVVFLGVDRLPELRFELALLMAQTRAQ